MSCGLAEPDFTDRYFENEGSDGGSKRSSVAETFVDDGPGSDTDVGSDIVEVIPYIDLHANHMTWDEFAQLLHDNSWRAASTRLRVAQTPVILNKIYHFAMQAKDNKIVMPAFTGFVANAGVATSLLATNHILYHQCRDTMYRDNEFVVDSHGSGLQYLSQNMGVGVCGHACSRQPRIKSLRLILGSEDHDQQGFFKCESFIQALKDMANQITVEHLHVELLPFCFLGKKDLAAFAFALKNKIKAEEDFELSGLDVHWEWNLRIVPMGLGMKMQPLNCNFVYHNDEEQKLGPFCCKYKPARNMNEKFGLGANGKKLEILDGKHFYELQQDGVYGGTADGY